MLRSKKNKDLTISSSNYIEWILNLSDSFPEKELLENNMQPIPRATLEKLISIDTLVKAVIYTYVKSLKRFVKNQFWLFPNILVQLSNDDEATQSQHISEKH